MHHLTFKEAEKYNPRIRIERRGELKGHGEEKVFYSESAWSFLPDESQEFQRHEQLLGCLPMKMASLLDGDASGKTIKVEMNHT